MNVLVTGATGFVGASLIRRLIDAEQTKVWITARPTSDLWRIEAVRDQLAGIFPVDLADRDGVSNLIQSIHPEVIYHLASYGGFEHQQDRQLMVQANLTATVNLLDAAVIHGVAQFINTGSSSEYGLKDQPMHEGDLCEPLSFYGLTKLAATNYCAMVGKTSGYRVCTLRLFSPYGQYEAASRLYPVIVNSLSQGEAPRLANPDSVRDFISIDRVVDVYLAIIHCAYQPGEIINLGSGKQMRVREFYQMISAKLGIWIEPIWGAVPTRNIEPRHWEADITRLRSLLPFQCDE